MRAWIGCSSSTTASAVSDFSGPYREYASAVSSGERPVTAPRIDNRFDTPGLAAGS